MKTLSGILLLALPLLCSAQEPETLRGLLNSLKKPVVVDSDASRKHHSKGKILVDHLVIYGLRDAGGRRFSVSYYGAYGENWLSKRQMGLFVMLTTPIEHFNWGGFTVARHSPEETEIAKMVADALNKDPKSFQNIPKRNSKYD